jgi:hypothetical protein
MMTNLEGKNKNKDLLQKLKRAKLKYPQLMNQKIPFDFS